jgi:protein-S-isoprenylcysteine O-methyltransferase Ste14
MDQLTLFFLLTVAICALALYWWYTDPRPLEQRIRYIRNRRTVVAYQVLCILLIQFFTLDLFPQIKLPGGTFIQIIGVILYVMAASLAVWAKRTMKSYWGPPAQHDTKKQNKLITWGPFAFSRNPIYVSVIIGVSGYFLALQSYLIIVVPYLFTEFYEAILIEETLLEKFFGKQYVAYKKKVRRFI